MTRILFSCLLIAGFIVSCSDKNGFDSTNPFANYFYALDSIPKVYLYRDVANGLDEQFQRIYAIKDHEGQHIIVETYSADGRITEALNFNTDSLDIMDHMVVNRNQEKTKAEVFKRAYFPTSKTSKSWFASRFQGFMDSTLILKECKRSYKEEKEMEVLGESKPVVVFSDYLRMTAFNPFTKKENVLEGSASFYYAEGLGLVEWHTQDKKVHYKLEKILSQQEWLKIITR